jgi:hypothetical protein
MMPKKSKALPPKAESVLETFLAVREPLVHSDREAESSRPSLLDSLALSSATTLENFRLARLSSAANLQKDMHVIFLEVLDQLAEAKLAELLLHNLRKGDAQCERNLNRSQSAKPLKS